MRPLSPTESGGAWLASLSRRHQAVESGVVFFTIEDETGIANLIKPKVFERYRALARGSSTVRVSGTVERNGRVVHVMVRSFHRVDATPSTAQRSRDFH
jgi:DNA polymerase III alpha subunit